ncbi:putative double-stranded RNA-binding protein Staufen isoform 3 [Cricetulus griseus]|nr:putative double-stranded RNA-binding protein Staufen isoform 3 [Cricetulus griseus]
MGARLMSMIPAAVGNHVKPHDLCCCWLLSQRVECDGLNRYGPHGLMCLNAWPIQSGTIRSGTIVEVGVALFEEVCHCGASLHDKMANPKEKTPMCLVNELARFHSIQPQYKLLSESGPAHSKKLLSFRRSHLLTVDLSICATAVMFRK